MSRRTPDEKKGTYLQPRGETDATSVCRVTLRLQKRRRDLCDYPSTFGLAHLRRFGHEQAVLARNGTEAAGVDGTTYGEGIWSVGMPLSLESRKSRPRCRQLSRNEEVAPPLPRATD